MFDFLNYYFFGIKLIKFFNCLLLYKMYANLGDEISIHRLIARNNVAVVSIIQNTKILTQI